MEKTITNNKKKPKNPKWEYGHGEEIGKDGNPTGRKIAWREDQKTGYKETTYHDRY